MRLFLCDPMRNITTNLPSNTPLSTLMIEGPAWDERPAEDLRCGNRRVVYRGHPLGSAWGSPAAAAMGDSASTAAFPALTFFSQKV